MENNKYEHIGINEWNKLPDSLKESYEKNFVFKMTPTEIMRYNAFKTDHKKCTENINTTIGDGKQPSVEFGITGIGHTVNVICPICGKKENITDYSSW